jgi:hypothetical protein
MLVASLLVLARSQGRAPIEVAGRDAAAGLVVDEQGRPVAGADVALSGRGYVPEDARVLGRARTDEGGRFRVEAQAEFRREPTVLRFVIAWKPGLAPARRPLNNFARSQEDTGQPMRLVLRPTVRRRLRIEGPDGRPVAGARITAVTVTDGSVPATVGMLPREVADRLAAVTDGDGWAEFATLSAPQGALLRVTSEVFGVQQIRHDPPDGVERTIRLTPVGRVSGRIVADDPKALRGLKVWGFTWSGVLDSPAPSGRFVGTLRRDERRRGPIRNPGRGVWPAQPGR